MRGQNVLMDVVKHRRDIGERATIPCRASSHEADAVARVLIGTSGWHYDSWRGPLFPADLPLKSQLRYYASQFRTAELNGVFYRTPTLETVKAWRAQAGKDFVFAWKASKFITHWKRLSDNSVNSLALIEERLCGERRDWCPTTGQKTAAAPTFRETAMGPYDRSPTKPWPLPNTVSPRSDRSTSQAGDAMDKLRGN